MSNEDSENQRVTVEELLDRVKEMEGRIEELSERRSKGAGVEVGDIITAVVEDPNADNDRDPVTHIDGMATFIKTPAATDIGFGDTVRVKIADIQSRQMVAALIERGHTNGGDG
jgi:tRNA A37 methylthiotransferase MiaB